MPQRLSATGHSRIRYLVVFAGAFNIIFGVIVLAGWIFRLRPLVQVSQGAPAVAPDTAIGFLAAGTGLLLLYFGDRRSAILAAGLPIFLGIAELSSREFGQFNHWIGSDLLDAVGYKRLPMAPITAVTLVLAGLALIALCARHLDRRFLWAIATAAAFVASLGALEILAVLIAGNTRYWGPLARMALQSAVAACCLGAGLCAVCLLRMQRSRDGGWLLAAVAGALGLIVLFAGVDAAVLNSAEGSVAARDQLGHAYRDISTLNDIVAAVQRCESAQRGFLLTGESSYFQRYLRCLPNTAQQIQIARRAGIPVSRLETLVQQKLAYLAQTVELERNGKHVEALAMIRSGVGARLMDEIDSERSGLQAPLELRARARAHDTAQSISIARRTVACSYALGSVLIGFVVWLLVRERRREAQLDAARLATQARLEQHVAERTAELTAEIGRRKQTEASLTAAEGRLQTALRLSGTAIWTWYHDPDRVVWNGPTAAVYGYSESEIPTYSEFRKKIHPDDLDAVETSLRNAAATGQEYMAEFRFLLPDGTARWLLGRGGNVLGENGEVVAMSGINMDITERKLAEERLIESARALKEHETQLALVFGVNAMGDFTWNVERDQVFCHPSVWEMYGVNADHPEWRPAIWFAQRQHPEDLPEINRAVSTMLATETPMNLEFRVTPPDSPLRWVHCRASVVEERDGKAVRVKGVTIDVTARKQAELKLRESEEQFRLLANSIPQVVWTARPDGAIDYYNDQWYAMTGFKRSSLQSTQQWHPIVHPDDLAPTAERWAESIVAGQPFEIECRYWDIRHHDFRWHLARGLPIRDQAGHIFRWVGTSTDIHEQRAARELLERQVAVRTEDLRRSLREKETLLKELHHRVKNNLQVVSSLLKMQSENLSDETAIRALLDSRQRVHSMALIHERLYTTRQMSEIDFGDYARSLVNELYHSLSHGGNINVRVESENVLLTLEQAIPCGLILNELVTNAFKYAYDSDQHGEVLIEFTERDAGRAVLRVRDEGRGMPADFDLATTTSLGLSVVSVLAKQLGGSLSIESGAMGGTAFTVVFPREARRSQDVSAA